MNETPDYEMRCDQCHEPLLLDEDGFEIVWANEEDNPSLAFCSPECAADYDGYLEVERQEYLEDLRAETPFDIV